MSDKPISYIPLSINIPQRLVIKSGKVVNLTDTEFEVLALLASNANRVFPRQSILEKVWKDPKADTRNVDACIYKLREKIEVSPQSPSFIQLLSGYGYFFDFGPVQDLYALIEDEDIADDQRVIAAQVEYDEILKEAQLKLAEVKDKVRGEIFLTLTEVVSNEDVMKL